MADDYPSSVREREALKREFALRILTLSKVAPVTAAMEMFRAIPRERRWPLLARATLVTLGVVACLAGLVYVYGPPS
jgi:hypothetical protein